jgi:hypothetical protein
MLRLVRCFGAMVAANACIHLLLESSKDQQVYIVLLINLFIMYALIGNDERLISNASKKEEEVTKKEGRSASSGSLAPTIAATPR